MTEQQLIDSCKRKDPSAQKELYNTYGPMFFAVCRRYLSSVHDAEDVFIEAMFKILTRINSFKGKGSFEGWMRRIVINEALGHLRKSKNFNLTIELDHVQIAQPSKAVSNLSAEEIMDCLEQLPTGYRTVFNLYEIEGYKHREIADKLGISINTSKSQLILARKRMQEILKKKLTLIHNSDHYETLQYMG